MKNNEYEILDRMLQKNRRLFQMKLIESEEYIENHDLIMERIKNVIVQFEKHDLQVLQKMDLDDSVERFRKEIFIVKYNLN